jgi:hypothetical protein
MLPLRFPGPIDGPLTSPVVTQQANLPRYLPASRKGSDVKQVKLPLYPPSFPVSPRSSLGSDFGSNYNGDYGSDEFYPESDSESSYDNYGRSDDFESENSEDERREEARAKAMRDIWKSATVSWDVMVDNTLTNDLSLPSDTTVKEKEFDGEQWADTVDRGYLGDIRPRTSAVKQGSRSSGFPLRPGTAPDKKDNSADEAFDFDHIGGVSDSDKGGKKSVKVTDRDASDEELEFDGHRYSLGSGSDVEFFTELDEDGEMIFHERQKDPSSKIKTVNIKPKRLDRDGKSKDDGANK